MEAKEDTDLLYGMPAIAAHLGIKTRAAYYLHESVGLPTFKLSGKVCARKSTLKAWLDNQEGKAND